MASIRHYAIFYPKGRVGASGIGAVAGGNAILAAGQHDMEGSEHKNRLGAMLLKNIITPTQLAANTDNWNPTGLSTADLIRASTDASRNLTGIVAPTTGRAMILANVGSSDLVLKHDVTSTAANRFYCPDNADVTVKRNTAVIIYYDATVSRWRVVGGTGGSVIVQEGDVTVVASDAVLDFGLGFDVTETPTGEANVAIDLLELTDFTDHSARHESAGADAIKLDDLAAPDDNTDLDASTSAHGLLKKLGSDPAKYLDNTGAFTVPGTIAGAASLGLAPYAYPIGFVPTTVVTNNAALGAGGGSRAAAIFVGSPMYLDGVWTRNLDTATARSWRWDLYYQASAASATLTRIATSNGSGTFTPTVASNRYLAASGAPVFLQVGLYWLVIQNDHATSTFSQGVVVAGSMSLDIAVSNLALTGTNGATIDLTSGSWSKVPSILACALYGRVFNESAAF